MSEELREYAEHLASCRTGYDMNGDCDCGLAEILAQETEEQEPIAFAQVLNDGPYLALTTIKPNDEQVSYLLKQGIRVEPLYAAPPSVKRLSDDELLEIILSMPYLNAVRLPDGYKEFANAIQDKLLGRE